MLQIRLKEEREFFDESANEFVKVPPQVLKLEHSLASISKWESKWHKAFLGKQEKTEEEVLDYINCMIVEGDLKGVPIYFILNEHYKEINDYISDSQTATWFNDKNGRGNSREVITSELIYYWMVAANIPFECQHWHLNRLLTLIRICGIKNAPPKKMGRKELMRRNTSLNAQRRAAMGTKG